MSKIINMKPYLTFFFLLIIISYSCTRKTSEKRTEANIVIITPEDQTPKDGRLLLIFAKNNDTEPRFQINGGLKTQVIYGMNIENHTPGTAIYFDSESMGFPIETLSDLEPGDYFVQALFHVYETFDLSTGHTVKLPMDISMVKYGD